MYLLTSPSKILLRRRCPSGAPAAFNPNAGSSHIHVVVPVGPLVGPVVNVLAPSLPCPCIAVFAESDPKR